MKVRAGVPTKVNNFPDAIFCSIGAKWMSFSRFSEKVPAVFFSIGTRDEATGCTTPAHNERFKMDDAKLENGAATFVQFVLDNQNGVDMQKVKDSEDR